MSFVKELLSRLRGEPTIARLQKQGLVVGRNVDIRPRVSIDFTFASLIEIGDDVTISEGAHILAHDASLRMVTGHGRIGRVRIGNRVFVGRGAVILPGVSIGDGSVVAANAVVTKDLPAGVVAGGVPAHVITSTEQWGEEHRRRMSDEDLIPWDVQINVGSDESVRSDLRTRLADGPAYVHAHPPKI